MNPNRIFLLLLIVGCLSACKKDGNFPPELRPDDFWVRCSIQDNDGQTHLFEYRGGNSSTVVPGLTLNLGYFSSGEIRDSIWYITSGLNAWPYSTPFYLRINHPDRVTDPFMSKDWRAADIADVLFPGKTYRFGQAPGEAEIEIGEFSAAAEVFGSNGVDNAEGYLRVLDVSDYGIPELGTPYFGKKVRVEFSANVVNNKGVVRRLLNGEASLFFRYYQF